MAEFDIPPKIENRCLLTKAILNETKDSNNMQGRDSWSSVTEASFPRTEVISVPVPESDSSPVTERNSPMTDRDSSMADLDDLDFSIADTDSSMVRNI